MSTSSVGMTPKMTMASDNISKLTNTTGNTTTASSATNPLTGGTGLDTLDLNSLLSGLGGGTGTGTGALTASADDPLAQLGLSSMSLDTKAMFVNIQTLMTGVMASVATTLQSILADALKGKMTAGTGAGATGTAADPLAEQHSSTTGTLNDPMSSFLPPDTSSDPATVKKPPQTGAI